MSKPSPAPTSDPTTWPFPFSQADWEQTPPAVQAYIAALHQELAQLKQRVEALEARSHATSQTSSRPPSSDSPYRKGRNKRDRKTSGRPGAKLGHLGARQTLLSPTATEHLVPTACRCGHTALTHATPSYTHQVIELPPITMDITHWVLYQATWPRCGHRVKAHLPPEQHTGYGPRLSALIGEMAGGQGTSRSLIQTFCASVLRFPIGLGAIQKVIDRVTVAIQPYYEAIARIARHAPVGYIDETPWLCQGTLQWLWVMTSPEAAFYRIDPNRSKAAFLALIADWGGILVSDGYGVYQSWVATRQTCLAHLIRRARGLSQRNDPNIAACGTRALAELQRLCHMAHSPPTGGQWRAWYARLCDLIHRYHDQQDEAGQLVRHLRREMDALWVFLIEHGVETTKNRAERALRFAVMWRKRSQGTNSDKGSRWVERILSLKETCRLQARSTYAVLVDAIRCSFHGQRPDTTWLYVGMP
jgi:transposase